MEKKSKITKVTPNGSFNGQHGTMYKFEVHFENGDYGDANCKSVDQKTWVVGETVTYTLAPNANSKYNGKLNKIKEPETQSNNNNSNPDRQKSIEKQCALKCAVELFKGGVLPDAKEVTDMAEKLNEWLINDGGENGSN